MAQEAGPGEGLVVFSREYKFSGKAIRFNINIKVLDALDKMASASLLGPIVDILAPEASMSYPHWLTEHVGP